MDIVITKNVITRDEAFKLAPHYVEYIEGDRDILFETVIPAFDELKRGKPVITFINGVYVRAKVSKVERGSYRAVDGPVIRVSNDEYSWRVDGDKYAFPI